MNIVLNANVDKTKKGNNREKGFGSWELKIG